jgi:hypothetical protein
MNDFLQCQATSKKSNNVSFIATVTLLYPPTKTILIGRISDVVQLGHGSNFFA